MVSHPVGVIGLWISTFFEIVLNAAQVHWDILRQDLHYTTRGLLRAPGFALTAIVVTALGIGANRSHGHAGRSAPRCGRLCPGSDAWLGRRVVDACAARRRQSCRFADYRGLSHSGFRDDRCRQPCPCDSRYPG